MLPALLRRAPRRSMATSAPAAALTAHLASTPVLSRPPPAGERAAGVPVIGTHSGSFHCDEALAVGMLKLLPRFAASPVVRTRDPAALAECDVAVDVGAVYDPAALRYDHHQASFTGVYSTAHDIKLSSAGLVFKHLGAEVVRAVVGPGVDEPTVAKLTARTYDHFVLELDGIDNGVEPTEGGRLRYRVSTGLASRVGRLNPAWNEDASEAVANARFAEAMALATGELVDSLTRAVATWLPARRIVVAARAAARQAHPSGRILVLQQFCPWKEHLGELEAEDAAEEAAAAPGAAAGGDDEGGDAPSAKRARAGDAPALPPALYMLYADSSGSWRVQAVPVDPESFACRKALPAAWRGLRDDTLSAAAGVPGCIFVHAGGFIGGAKTYEGALALATQALDME